MSGETVTQTMRRQTAPESSPIAQVANAALDALLGHPPTKLALEHPRIGVLPSFLILPEEHCSSHREHRRRADAPLAMYNRYRLGVEVDVVPIQIDGLAHP